MNTSNNYQVPDNLLKKKIIAISGAGSGIGRIMAKTFAQHGATVILIGRTVDKLERVYDEIEAAGYPQAAIFPINFAEAGEDQYQELANAIEENFGRLDGLLNNASILGDRTSIASYKLKTFEAVMRVNITAPFLLTKHLLPHLKKSENASVIFTGSSVGLKGRAYWGAYAVSKAATENLMQILADELEGTTNIRVNSINPGATRTQMRADAFPAENPDKVKDPEALCPLYLYLMGDDSLGVNGQQFNYSQQFNNY